MCSLASSDGEKEEDSARKKMTVMGGGLSSWIDPGFLAPGFGSSSRMAVQEEEEEEEEEG